MCQPLQTKPYWALSCFIKHLTGDNRWHHVRMASRCTNAPGWKLRREWKPESPSSWGQRRGSCMLHFLHDYHLKQQRPRGYRAEGARSYPPMQPLFRQSPNSLLGVAMATAALPVCQTASTKVSVATWSAGKGHRGKVRVQAQLLERMGMRKIQKKKGPRIAGWRMYHSHLVLT